MKNEHMKKILAILVIMTVALPSFAQKAPKKPIKKATYSTKKVKASLPKVTVRKPADEVIYTKENSTSIFDIQNGDTLIYEVNASGSTYDYWVIVNEFSYEKGIDFSWLMTDPVNKSGRVKVSPSAKSDATKYVNYFAPGVMQLKDACTVWLSGKNFGDMPSKETMIQLDNDAPEKFSRPENDEVTYDINYRGKEIKLDAFIIQSNGESYNKQIHILNTSGNPLIVAMDLGWTIRLKEVR